MNLELFLIFEKQMGRYGDGKRNILLDGLSIILRTLSRLLVKQYRFMCQNVKCTIFIILNVELIACLKRGRADLFLCFSDRSCDVHVFCVG